ncbi:uncharacterized protein [Ptychodera flava]|uniref:uncharacterized protein isoform X2 n=1 Tax=Ptychodera flava TaxID=63121 RepID=UPI003969CE06
MSYPPFGQIAGTQLYPSLTDPIKPQLPNGVQRDQNALPLAPLARSLILWPNNGDNIRIHSMLSKQRDGFLRVRKKVASVFEQSSLMVDAKGRLDKPNTLFRFYTTRERSQLQNEDEVYVWLGIPGERIGKSKHYVYMLKTYQQGNNKIIVAKAFKKSPQGDIFPPNNVSANDAELLKFRIGYEGNGIFSIRDSEVWNHLDQIQPRYHYLRVNANGVISRVRRNPRLHRPEYNDPGMLFYMMHLGKDSDLRDGN